MLPIASVMAINLVHVTDTDVVVIAIAVTNVLRDCEIWIAFGHGAEQRYIPCHAIAAELGKGRTHRGVHFSFTRCQSGCDTVSAFHHSMELGREQHVLFGPVCLLSHRFLLGCPVRKARYSATT